MVVGVQRTREKEWQLNMTGGATIKCGERGLTVGAAVRVSTKAGATAFAIEATELLPSVS